MSPMNNRLMRPRASSGFSPKNISNLAAWYDISSTTDGSKVTTVDGAISALIDLSGNGKNAIQNTANNRPSAVTAAYNGLDVARFSNASPVDFLTASNVSFSLTPYTVFFAIAHTSSTGLHAFIADGAAASSLSCPAFWVASGVYGVLKVGVGASASTLARTANAMQVFTATGNGTSGGNFASSTLRRNKGTTATAAGLNNVRTDCDRFFIGAGAAGGDSPFVGDIGEVLVYQRALSTAEIESVEAYLAKKWGVTLT